jgi:hypothetical protein
MNSKLLIPITILVGLLVVAASYGIIKVHDNETKATLAAMTAADVVNGFRSNELAFNLVETQQQVANTQQQVERLAKNVKRVEDWSIKANVRSNENSRSIKKLRNRQVAHSAAISISIGAVKKQYNVQRIEDIEWGLDDEGYMVPINTTRYVENN